MQDSIKYILQILPQMLEGLKITIKLFVVTLVLSLPLGLLISLFKEAVSKRPTDNFVIRWIVKMPIRFIINVYLWVFRGTPLLLQLFFFYFGLTYVTLPNGESITLSMFTAAVISFVLNYAAYFAEIYRSGIESMPVGQYEAAKVLGYSRVQTFFRIILPQVIKRVLPAVTNEMITLVKDTSLAFTLSVMEMFTTAKALASSQVSMMPFVAAGIFYYVFNLVVAMFLEWLEKKLDYYR